MKKLGTILPVAMLLLFTAINGNAQTGCIDSPEDPTLISGIIAAVAAFGFSRLWKNKDVR